MTRTTEVLTEEASAEDAAPIRENLWVNCLRSEATVSIRSNFHRTTAVAATAAMRRALPRPVNGSMSSPVQKGMMKTMAYLASNPGEGSIRRCDYLIKPLRFQGIVTENVAEIDVTRALAAKKRAEEALANLKPEELDMHRRMESALRRSNLRLDAVRRYRRVKEGYTDQDASM